MIKRYKALAIGIFLFSLFAAGCGELGSVITPANGYRVSANINGSSIEEHSIVDYKSTIEPFFQDSILNDPDIIGLRVSLHALNGELAARKILYTWNSALTGSANSDWPYGSSQTDSQNPQNPGNSSSSSQNSANTSNSSGSANTSGSSDAASASSQNSTSASPNNEAPENRQSADSPTSAPGYSDAAPDTNAGTAAGTGQSGSASTTALSDSAALLNEESAESESATARPPNAAAQSVQITGNVENFYAEQVITLSAIDRYLPSFSFPENLAIGQYLLVFQVVGIQGVVNSAEKYIFYIGNAELSLGEIKTYYPTSADSPITAPGTTIMLEAQIAADPRLDPYLIWYNGIRRIKEGYQHEDVHRILWNVPDQTGFQNIRVEAYPFKPENVGNHAIRGRTIALSLPVRGRSAQSAKPSNADAIYGNPIRHYSMAGTLADALAPFDAGRALKSLEDRLDAKWLPWGNNYGLYIGSDQRYALPSNLFALPRDTNGIGFVLFRFAPLEASDSRSVDATQGGSASLFAASFALEYTDETFALELSCENGELLLNYGIYPEVYSVALPLAPGATQTAALYVSFDQSQASIALLDSADENPNWDSAESVQLPGAFTGMGSFSIGGSPEWGSSVAFGTESTFRDRPYRSANPGLVLMDIRIHAAQIESEKLEPEREPEEIPEEPRIELDLEEMQEEESHQSIEDPAQ